MEALQQWALAVCAAAVLCTVVSRLFTDNSLGRQGRMLLPCLFLLAVLAPLSGGLQNFSLPDVTAPSTQQSEALQSRVHQQTAAYVNETLLKMANQALNSYGVQAKKVVTDINFASDGSINMGQITVYIDKNAINMTAVARQVVQNRLGTDVVIAVWEENGG
ncbi:MAG: hypothetical protein IJB26_05035 [Clostridia bacterium]|nr:hypothetical protein [Clostridia bacterium]